MSDGDPVHVETLTTYLACPRLYEFQFETGLTGDEQWSQDAFRQVLRDTICTGLAVALGSDENPCEVALAALDAEWSEYAENTDHHSPHQDSAERSRAEAAIEAYFDDNDGPGHLEGIRRAEGLFDSAVVGPDISLTATISGHSLEADVDYIMVDSGRLVGVRLTENLWGCKVPWPSKTDIVSIHFDFGRYKPRQVGTVLTGRVVEKALEGYAGDGTGPELLYQSVMEQTFERDGAFEAWLDHRWMGDYLEDSRRDVDDAIDWLCSNLDGGVFSPATLFDEQDHWNGSFDTVVDNECRYCAYAAGCQDKIRRDVMFNV